MKKLLTLVCVLILASCAPMTPLILTPEGERIPIGNNDPGPGFVLIGGVEGADGSGCGLFGRRGDFNGALLSLRTQAQSMGGQYIKIVSQTPPHHEGGGQYGCFVNAYRVEALVYRKTN